MSKPRAPFRYLGPSVISVWKPQSLPMAAKQPRINCHDVSTLIHGTGSFWQAKHRCFSAASLGWTSSLVTKVQEILGQV